MELEGLDCLAVHVLIMGASLGIVKSVISPPEVSVEYRPMTLSEAIRINTKQPYRTATNLNITARPLPANHTFRRSAIRLLISWPIICLPPAYHVYNDGKRNTISSKQTSLFLYRRCPQTESTINMPLCATITRRSRLVYSLSKADPRFSSVSYSVISG